MVRAQLPDESRDTLGAAITFVKEIPVLVAWRALQKSHGEKRIRIMGQPFPFFALDPKFAAVITRRTLEFRSRKRMLQLASLAAERQQPGNPFTLAAAQFKTTLKAGDHQLMPDKQQARFFFFRNIGVIDAVVAILAVALDLGQINVARVIFEVGQQIGGAGIIEIVDKFIGRTGPRDVEAVDQSFVIERLEVTVGGTAVAANEPHQKTRRHHPVAGKDVDDVQVAAGDPAAAERLLALSISVIFGEAMLHRRRTLRAGAITERHNFRHNPVMMAARASLVVAIIITVMTKGLKQLEKTAWVRFARRRKRRGRSGSGMHLGLRMPCGVLGFGQRVGCNAARCGR